MPGDPARRGARRAAAAVGLIASTAGLVAAAGNLGSADPAPAAATALDGADLFVAKGCAMCHDGPASDSAMDVGPPLVDASAWAGDRRPDMDAESYLAESMTAPAVFRSPAASTGGELMPALALSAEEVDLLVDHLLDR